MSIFFEDHKNIFELLKEDDGSDIINGGDTGASDADSDTSSGGDDASAGTDNNDNNSEENTDDSSGGGDDDFNIDTSLDDDSGEGGDDSDSGDDNSSSDLDSSTTDDASSSEAIPANKDIFTTLTAEEQAIKIKEQKKQYNDMYIYIDDLIDKINDIDFDESNAIIIERISRNLFRLRDYLAEYIETTFNMKDYYTNDVFFRRFLYVLYSIDSTMQDLAKGRAKKLGLNDEETDKK